MTQEPSVSKDEENKIMIKLPMITWLKGDEDYFEDFSWDAKKVMDVLGIKRSRLTQISGQELRVGKARIDRYLRPVYRPEDVENYLKWTQPTASHKRSTGIVDQARKKLEETAEELKKSLQQSPSGFQKIFLSLNKQISQNIFLMQQSLFTKIKIFFESFIKRLHHDNQKIYNKVQELEEQLAKLQQDNKIILQQALAKSEENSEILKQLKDLKEILHLSQIKKKEKTIFFPKTAPLLHIKSTNSHKDKPFLFKQP